MSRNTEELHGITLLGNQKTEYRSDYAPGMHGHAAGVVPPVFQPLQALYQQAHDVARRNRAYDAAHVFYPFERVRCEGAMLGAMR